MFDREIDIKFHVQIRKAVPIFRHSYTTFYGSFANIIAYKISHIPEMKN